MKKVIFLFMISILLCGCFSMKVTSMSPRPNVDIEPTNYSLALQIDDDINNMFVVPGRNGMSETTVENWRISLKNGFTNAFEDFFTLTEDVSTADLVLKLKRTDLEFAPAAVSGYYGVVAINAQITFNAQLVDQKGEVVARSSGTSTSKNATNNGKEVTLISMSAVESMYEILANDFFTENPSASVKN